MENAKYQWQGDSISWPLGREANHRATEPGKIKVKTSQFTQDSDFEDEMLLHCWMKELQILI